MQATRAQRSQRRPSCSTRILTQTYGSEGAELLENAMDLRALLGSCFETCGAGGLVSAMDLLWIWVRIQRTQIAFMLWIIRSIHAMDVGALLGSRVETCGAWSRRFT